MAQTIEEVILSISADVSQVKRALQRLTGDTKQATKTIEGEWTRVDNAVKRTTSTIQRGGQQMTTSVRQVRAQTTNLGFQLNDISQGLMSGTSPFTLMVQQGSQVAQIFQQIGGGAAGMKALGGAFLSMLSPVSILTSGLILLTGYAVQYFTSVESGGKEAEETLKKEQQLIDGILQKWGDLLPTLKEIEEARKAIADASELESVTEAKARELFAPVLTQLHGMVGLFGDVKAAMSEMNTPESSASLREFIDLTAALDTKMRAGTARVEDMTAIMDVLRKTFGDTNPEANKLIDQFGVLATTIGRTAEKTDELRKQALGATEQQKKYNEAMEELRKAVDGPLTEGERLLKLHETAIANATTSMRGYVNAIGLANIAIKKVTDTLGDMVKAQVPLGTVPPVVTGGGGFLDPQQLQDFNANAVAAAEVLDSAAAQMIKAEEGFINASKWDVNAFRVGFGSDTYVDELGRVQKVTKDTVITLDQANADLARRIPEFQQTIISAIGADMWKSFSEDQQAALSSIAYNYGSLPDSIVRAIQQGGGQEKIAAAIASLSANPERRRREAQAFGGAPTAARARATPSEIFSRDTEKTQDRIRLLQAEYDALSKLSPAVDDYGFSVEKAQEKQRLMNEAQSAGVTITPELEKQIDDLATGYARASASVEELKTSQAAAAAAAQELGSLAKDFLSGFISDLREGKSATEALANALGRLGDRLLDMSLDLLIGSITKSFGVAQRGGEVGNLKSQRQVSPLAFVGAKRYQRGGLVLKPGEVPIIAHQGELVIPRNMLRRGPGGSSQNISTNLNGDVNIDMSATGKVAANSDDAKEFGLRVQKAVQLIMVQESRPGGLLRQAGATR